MLNLMLIFIYSLFISTSLLAKEFTEPPLLGQGQYKWLFLNVYEAKLWAYKSGNLYSQPLMLDLKYNRNFKGKEIVDQSLKELVNSGVPKTELTDWRSKLANIFVDVKEGDTIRAVYTPEAGVTFYLNSTTELGRLSNVEFSKKFLDIWLGEKTSAPELRSKLLGKNI